MTKGSSQIRFLGAVYSALDGLASARSCCLQTPSRSSSTVKINPGYVFLCSAIDGRPQIANATVTALVVGIYVGIHCACPLPRSEASSKRGSDARTFHVLRSYIARPTILLATWGRFRRLLCKSDATMLLHLQDNNTVLTFSMTGIPAVLVSHSWIRPYTCKTVASVSSNVSVRVKQDATCIKYFRAMLVGGPSCQMISQTPGTMQVSNFFLLPLLCTIFCSLHAEGVMDGTSEVSGPERRTECQGPCVFTDIVNLGECG